MSGYTNNIQAYKKAFASVDKINQVIMLYDTAIASMQRARQAILDKNIETRFNSISKTFQIIAGLKDSLDMDKGGEVASALSEWYSGTSLRILSVNRTENLEMCDMCIAHIKQMRDAWLDIENQIKTKNTSSSSEAPMEESSTANSDNGGGSIEAASNDDFFEKISKAAISSGMSISI
jgi:flagellar protein FliS